MGSGEARPEEYWLRQRAFQAGTAQRASPLGPPGPIAGGDTVAWVATPRPIGKADGASPWDPLEPTARARTYASNVVRSVRPSERRRREYTHVGPYVLAHSFAVGSSEGPTYDERASSREEAREEYVHVRIRGNPLEGIPTWGISREIPHPRRELFG